MNYQSNHTAQEREDDVIKAKYLNSKYTVFTFTCFPPQQEPFVDCEVYVSEHSPVVFTHNNDENYRRKCKGANRSKVVENLKKKKPNVIKHKMLINKNKDAFLPCLSPIQRFN